MKTKRANMLAAMAVSGGISLMGLSGEYKAYWGDTHSHTKYSDDAFGCTSYVEDALRYAKKDAGLDFVMITDHAIYTDTTGTMIKDPQVSGTQEEWLDIKKKDDAFYQENVFVPFIAYEYTNSTGNAGTGHRNVIFVGDSALTPYCDTDAYWIEGQGMDPREYAKDPTKLWGMLAEDGYDYITIPHHPARGNFDGTEQDMSTDWNFVGKRQPLVEIYSVHGSSEYKGCDESVDPEAWVDGRGVEDALVRWLLTGNENYKLGIIASTDTHEGKPGSVAEAKENFNLKEGPYTGGLAAVLAKEFTRESIYEAMKAKRVYATSGPRFDLDFRIAATVNAEPCEAILGGTIASAKALPVKLSFNVSGVNAGNGKNGGSAKPIEKVQVYKNGVLLKEITAANGFIDGQRFTLSDTALSSSYYRIDAFQEPTISMRDLDGNGWFSTNNKDGLNEYEVEIVEKAWSSPVWVEIENHLANPCATDGLNGWQVYGNAKIVGGADPDEADYTEELKNEQAFALAGEGAYIFQDVKVPAGSKKAILSAFLKCDKSDARTGFPYLYAYQLNSRGKIVQYMKTDVVKATHWTQTTKSFNLNKNAVTIRCFLMRSAVNNVTADNVAYGDGLSLTFKD